MNSRRNFLAALAASPLAALPGAAFAQAEWPARAVKVVVPFSAGGVTDLVTRIVADGMRKHLPGANLVIENKPGVGGNVGATAVATAAPDGYTLLAGTLSTYALNAGLYDNLGHDPRKDLIPVALTAMVPIVIVVNPALGVKDLKGFIALMKANPGKYNYGSAGNGTSSHIALHLLLQKTGTKAEHIPYKGTAQVITDLLANNVQFAVASPAVVQSYIRDGKLIAVAAVSPTRLAALPQVPTVAEAGLKDFDAYSWNGLFAPANTPMPIVEKLHAAVEATLKDPAVRAKLDQQGTLPMSGMSRAQINSHVLKEYERWVPFVKQMGVKVD